MKEIIENSKKLIQESAQLSLRELEKTRIELEAKSRLFATSIGLVNHQRYFPS